MRVVLVFVCSVAVGLLLGGCLQAEEGPSATRPNVVHKSSQLVVEGLAVSTLNTTDGPLQARAASGSVSRFVLNTSKDAMVEFPANVFYFDTTKHWFTTSHKVTVKSGQEFDLLVPPGMTTLNLTVDGAPVAVPTPDTGHGFFNGADIVAWYKVLRDQYPNRCAACPSYGKSQQYFAGLFKSFGYGTVEVDPYGMDAQHSTFANVVAYRYPKTDLMHPQWLGVGGHYDVVTNTREGAFDNTAGTLGSLELAKALANMTPSRNIAYGLWGGEESGLQGSAFFTKTNPNIAAQMQLYVNLDVIGFSWPGPQPVARDGTTPDCSKRPAQSATSNVYCQDPVLVSGGPDGPVATNLIAFGKKVQTQVMVGYPSEYFIYEPILNGGQVGGYAAVNAQSDHTSFMAAGVPVYFLFNGDALKNPIGIHNQKDTVANWTKYEARNFPVDLGDELGPDEVALGETLIAKSFETYLWVTFYSFLYTDLGLFNPVVPMT